MSENVTEQVLLCSESENVTSFAHQQAGIPLLHRLLIANKGTEPLVKPSLRIRTDPLFASPCVINLSDIGAGVETILYEDALNIRLSPEFLSAQRERTDGFVVLELYSGEKLVAQDIIPLSVLAYNEWSGLAELPDLLAAFCTPNQPAVAGILSKASGILKKITKRGELDAYQSADPKRVMRIAESIFIATQKCGIAYCVPPASYEAEGQKIRFPEELVASRLGSCLDLALHFCACMESAGLHPLLIVDKGHAYAGCWLKAGDSFDLSVESDLQQFRKLVAGTDPHIVVFETTMAAGGSETGFDEAETHARKHLEQSEEFRFALDIQRARANRILPLPVSVHEGRIVISDLAAQEHEAKPMDDEVLDGRFGGDDASLQDKAESRDRLSVWANQLLDLSLRNRLLNFGKNKSIELRTHALHILEDRVASKDEFTLLPDVENDPRSAELHNKRNGERLDESRLKADLDARKLRVACTKDELDKRLLSLSRDARIGLEEGGANTLYLALGVLEWKDSVRTDRVNRAPILLVPVSLTRQSVRSGYKLRRLDEETRVNVTLLEKLKRDFEIEVKGVNPPPEDKAGVDVPLVLKRFREAVLQSKGFEVREEAHLGVFQFAKFLLWKDLMDRAELLKRNPVVAHLIDNSNQPYRTGDDVPFAPVAPSVLDDQLPAVKNYCIMDADSSQLSAVASAAAGLSFVMIGPPGTGKSQTISNIISFLIAMGKTVLFVAEKRAALEVVKGRLEKAGLGPFFLELHSNKTGKAEVIEQFRQAVNFGEGSTPEQWTMFGTELQRLRENLNSTVRALHFPLPNGMSAYRCNGVLVGTKGEYPRLTFKKIASHTPEQVSHMRGKLRDLSGHLEGISDFAAHPLIMVRYPEWTPYWEGQALEALAQLRNAAAILKSSAEELGKCLEMENPELSLSELNSYAALLEHSLEVPPVGEKFIQDTSSSNILEITRQGAIAIRSLAEARVALDGWKLDRLSGLKVAQMVTDWIDANMAFFLLRPLKRNRIKKLLAQYSIASHVPENDEVEALLQRIANFQSCQKILADTAQAIGPVFGPLWAKAQAEPSLLEKAQQWHKRFTSLLHTFAGTRLYLPSTFRGRLSAILSKEPEKIAPTGAIAQAAHAYSAALKTFGTKWQNVCAAFCFEKNQWEGLPMPSSALEIAERIEKHSGELRQWCRIRKLRWEIDNLELAPLVDALDAGRIKSGELEQCFERSYAKACLDKLVGDEPLLREFFGDEHNRRIREFRRIDESLTKMASKTVAALVASGKPRMDAKDKPADFGEVGALNTEMSKRSRHKPIRKLISEIPTILPKLKPCLLMSPLSVAQYLDASHPPFDVVVFDEASQIPVSDAIGVMARGKQVIVTGDPQQLPPTSFFQRGMELSDEEFALMEAEGIPEDAESILDECRARGLPDINLAWHYRSKHESLIAFSNHHYYGGSLLTNPEPEIRDEGVKLVNVDGVYDRGKSRTNLREAEEVVKAIAAHYRDEKLHGVSIGVVTFNSQQQSLIETLLDAERQKDAELDMLVANDEREPLFIKNLENVQGDERDVIIFSTTYGKDQSGRPSNNFGPINKPGGHRRLNVAITRARLGVVVFTSLRPEDIDLSRTKERGPRHLKAYLEFAARGKMSLPAIIKGESRDEYDSGFELKVAEALRSQGWEVHTQIGCSSYRIDLAVVHPEHAGAYAIGIECDGATYHSSATARDRDRLRQSVLERLGWRIHRVWSTDWFRDYEKEKTRLFEAVSKAIENYSPDGAAIAQEQEEAVEAPAESEALDAKPDEPAAEAAKAPDSAGVPYQMVQISQTMKGLDPYNPATVEALRFAIASVVDKEGPVALTLLCDRIAAILEMKRSTTKLKDRLLEILPRNIPRTKTSSNTFIWSSKAGPDAYKEFRVHDGNDDFRRALSDICPQEQANAMEHVVRSYQSVPTEDLLRQVVLLFGYNNLTQQMKDMLRPGLKQLEKRKGIQKTSSGYAFKG